LAIKPTSPLAELKALPLSKVSIEANKSTFCSIKSANLYSNLDLSSGVVSFQVLKAFSAASMACSTSSAPPSYISQIRDSL